MKGQRRRRRNHQISRLGPLPGDEFFGESLQTHEDTFQARLHAYLHAKHLDLVGPHAAHFEVDCHPVDVV